MDIKLVTDEEAELVDFVVCVLASQDAGVFTDNVRTTCADCGADIVHRPYVPKRPPKICMDCATARMGGTH